MKDPSGPKNQISVLDIESKKVKAVFGETIEIQNFQSNIFYLMTLRNFK